MAGEGAFTVEASVIEALPNGTYRVELANGHRLLGFVAGKAKNLRPRFLPGERVRVKVSAYDLSEGRIILEG